MWDRLSSPPCTKKKLIPPVWLYFDYKKCTSYHIHKSTGEFFSSVVRTGSWERLLLSTAHAVMQYYNHGKRTVSGGSEENYASSFPNFPPWYLYKRVKNWKPLMMVLSILRPFQSGIGVQVKCVAVNDVTWVRIPAKGEKTFLSYSRLSSSSPLRMASGRKRVAHKHSLKLCFSIWNKIRLYRLRVW